MIVIRFLESLEQLTITYVGLDKPIQPHDVTIDQNIISVGQQKIKIIPEDSFRLESDSLRFNSSECDGSWSVTMMLGAKLCKEIESSKLEEWCPPLDDLLNDWIFCHQHGDNPINVEEIKPKVSSSTLESISQITFLLRKQSIMSTVLFESENKNDNLAVRVINPRIFIGLGNNIDDSSVCEIILQQAAAIQYKKLSKSDDMNEVKKLRHCFKVDWYVISSGLFNQFVETVQQNNLNKFFAAQVTDEDNFLDAFI